MVIIFLMADVYVWNIKRVKNMQFYTLKKFGAWVFLLIDEKIYLVSNCHVKKLLWNLSFFSFKKKFIILFCPSWLFFIIKKNEKFMRIIIFFYFLRLNVAIYVLKKCKVEIINPSQNNPNTLKPKTPFIIKKLKI